MSIMYDSDQNICKRRLSKGFVLRRMFHFESSTRPVSSSITQIKSYLPSKTTKRILILGNLRCSDETAFTI